MENFVISDEVNFSHFKKKNGIAFAFFSSLLALQLEVILCLHIITNKLCYLKRQPLTDKFTEIRPNRRNSSRYCQTYNQQTQSLKLPQIRRQNLSLL